MLNVPLAQEQAEAPWVWCLRWGNNDVLVAVEGSNSHSNNTLPQLRQQAAGRSCGSVYH